MFRDMRRKEKMMEGKEALERLNEANFGILSVNGENGYPYGVPVNYSVYDNKIVIHGSLEGHKVDAIKKNDKVCFTVVLDEELVPSRFTSQYESLVVYGQTRILEDSLEKEKALLTLIEKYSSDFIKAGKKYVQGSSGKTCVLLVEINSITGKRSKNSGK